MAPNIKIEAPQKPPTKKPLICHFCDRHFAQSFSLSRHIRIHTGERPHKCHLCTACFIQKSDLNRHMTIHDPATNFACSICDKKFKTKKNLSCHMLIHTVDRPFKCKDCDKDFQYKRLLKYHEGIHLAQKPYNCDMCGKGFGAKPNLKSHLRTHLKRMQKKLSLIKVKVEKRGLKLAKSRILSKKGLNLVKNGQNLLKSIKSPQKNQTSTQVVTNLPQDAQISPQMPNYMREAQNTPHDTQNMLSMIHKLPPRKQFLLKCQILENSPQVVQNPVIEAENSPQISPYSPQNLSSSPQERKIYQKTSSTPKCEPIEVINSPIDFISSSTSSVDQSENGQNTEWNLFFKSMQQDLNKMDEKQKRKFKTKIYGLIDEIMQ